MARLPDELVVNDRVRIPARELDLSYARSGGPGGQHVNKTETKVVLRWRAAETEALDDADRAWVLRRLASRLTTEGELVVTSETHRDQRRNVEDALDRMAALVREALHRPKRRKKTRPSRAARQRRLDEKKRRGERKRERRKPFDL
jgi:ribosome-associated protein